MNMSTAPYIPTGPLPSFPDIEREDAELWGAHASRVSVVASRDDELSDAPFPARAPHHEETPACSPGAEFSRETNDPKSPSPRDACAPRNSGTQLP